MPWNLPFAREGAPANPHPRNKKRCLSPFFFSDGRWAGLDDAIATGGGAVIGVAGQGISDLIQGHLSSWQNYTAAGVGGAAAGEATLYGGPIAGGLAYGAVSNCTLQGLNLATGQQQSFNTTSFVTSTAVSGVLSYAGSEILPYTSSFLSNSTKGAIGENLSYGYNILKGNEYVGSQIPIPVTVDGAVTYVDNSFLTPEGDMLWVESKFGTSTIQGNQVLANNAYDNYIVETWDYNFVAKVGGIASFGVDPTITQSLNGGISNNSSTNGITSSEDPLSSQPLNWKVH